jgi:hypothetical protein
MPLRVRVTLTNKTYLDYYIPVNLMINPPRSVTQDALLPDWDWVQQQYTFTIPVKQKWIERVEIDPKWQLADTDRSDNVYKK